MEQIIRQDDLSNRVEINKPTSEAGLANASEFEDQGIYSQSPKDLLDVDKLKAKKGEEESLEGQGDYFVSPSKNRKNADLPESQRPSFAEVTGSGDTAFISSMPSNFKSLPFNPRAVCPSDAPEPFKAKMAKMSPLFNSGENKSTEGIVHMGDAQSAFFIPPDVAAAPHPLLNNVILKNLFEYLKKEDVRSARLVHPTWNLEALSFLKKTCPFLHIVGFPEKRCFDYSAYIRELTNYIRNSTPANIPFSIEKVCFSKIPPEVQFDEPDWQKLLTVLAKLVTEVIVHVREQASHFIPLGITFSKLTILQVRESSFCMWDDRCLGTMVECSPNLKSLLLDQANYSILKTLSKINGLKLQTFKLLAFHDDIWFTLENPEDVLVEFLKSPTYSLEHLVLGATIDIFRIYPNITTEIPDIRITTE